jgi:hypothetical protein
MSFSTTTFLDPLPFMRGTAPSPRIQAVHAALVARGVDGAIAELNAGVPHRYTGIFKLDGEWLRNTHMFDKLGEARPEALEAVALSESFCQIVLRDGYFITENTAQDDRLNYSPFKGVVMSYHGVPLLNNFAQLGGTLCHFDMVEQSISDDEFLCLQEAAKIIPAYLRG